MGLEAGVGRPVESFRSFGVDETGVERAQLYDSAIILLLSH